MSNENSHKIEIAAEKLYKLVQTSNRESAKNQGYYDGRFNPRVMEDKKKNLHLELRRDKHRLKGL